MLQNGCPHRYGLGGSITPDAKAPLAGLLGVDSRLGLNGWSVMWLALTVSAIASPFVRCDPVHASAEINNRRRHGSKHDAPAVVIRAEADKHAALTLRADPLKVAAITCPLTAVCGAME